MPELNHVPYEETQNHLKDRWSNS